MPRCVGLDQGEVEDDTEGESVQTARSTRRHVVQVAGDGVSAELRDPGIEVPCLRRVTMPGRGQLGTDLGEAARESKYPAGARQGRDRADSGLGTPPGSRRGRP